MLKKAPSGTGVVFCRGRMRKMSTTRALMLSGRSAMSGRCVPQSNVVAKAASYDGLLILFVELARAVI